MRIRLLILLSILLLGTKGNLWSSHPENTTTPQPTSDSIYLETAKYITSHRSWQIAPFTEKRVNTYLSPLSYSGIGIAMYSTQEQPLSQKNSRWIYKQEGMGYTSLLLNPAKTASFRIVGGSFEMDFLYKIPLPYAIRWGIGPLSFSEISFFSQSRNQNNPMDVEIHSDLGIGTLIAYRLSYKRFICDFRLWGSLSLAGISFSPNYRESYLQALMYENWSKNIHPTILGYNKHFYQINSSIEIPISRLTTIVLGVQHINSATYINQLFRGRQRTLYSIGFSTDFRSFFGKELLDQSNLQSALWN